MTYCSLDIHICLSLPQLSSKPSTTTKCNNILQISSSAIPALEISQPGDIRRTGFTERTTILGKEYKRRVGTSSWILVSAAQPPPLPTPPHAVLHPVRTNQFEGEPLHWASVIAPLVEIVSHSTGPTIIHILEVRGDPGDLDTGMHHSFNLESKVAGGVAAI